MNRDHAPDIAIIEGRSLPQRFTSRGNRLWAFLCVCVGLVLAAALIFATAKSSPAMAVAAVAGLACIPVLFRYPILGIMIVIALAPLGQFGQISMSMSYLTLNNMLLCTLLFFFIIHWAVNRGPVRYFSIIQGRLNALFLLIVVISTVVSLDPALAMGKNLRFMNGLFLILLLCNYAGTRKAVTYALFTFAISMTFYTFQSELAYLLNIEGFSRVTPVGEVRRLSSYKRVGPNEYGMWLVSVLPVVYYWFAQEKDLRKKLFWLAALVINLFGTLLTFSRATFYTMVIGVMIVIWLERSKLNARNVALALAVIALVGVTIGPQVMGRATSVARVEEDDAIQGRISYLKTGFAIFKDYPLIGVGPTNYRFATTLPEYAESIYVSPWEEEIAKKYGRPPGRVAHNSYMEVLCELGVFGFTAFVSMLGLSLLSIMRSSKTLFSRGDAAMGQLTRGLWVGMTMFCINAFFLTVEDQLLPWFMIGISGALALFVRDTAEGGA